MQLFGFDATNSSSDTMPKHLPSPQTTHLTHMSLFSAAPVAAASYNSSSATPAVGYAPSTLVFGFGGVYDTMLQCPQRHYLTLGVLDPPGAYDCNRCKAHRPRGETHYQCRACDYDVCVQCRPVYSHQQQSAPDFTLLEKIQSLRTAIDDTRSQVRHNNDIERQHHQQINNRIDVLMSAVVGLQRDVHRLSEELSAARSNPSVVSAAPSESPYPPGAK